jgi:hypothetical protein
MLIVQVGSIALIAGVLVIIRRLKRNRNLQKTKAAYALPPPNQSMPTPSYQETYSAPEVDSRQQIQFGSPLSRSTSFPVEHYGQSYVPVVMEGRDFNIRRKTVGGEGEMGVGGYEEKVALSNIGRTSMAEDMQPRNSMAENRYPRDVKAPPGQFS